MIKRRRHACDQHFIIIGRDFKIFFYFLQRMPFKLILGKKLVFILLLSLFIPYVRQTLRSQPQGSTDLPLVGYQYTSRFQTEQYGKIREILDRTRTTKMIHPVEKVETPDRSHPTSTSDSFQISDLVRLPKRKLKISHQTMTKAKF